MSEEVASVEHEGWTVQSNSSDKDSLTEAITGEKPKAKVQIPPAKEPETDEEKRKKAASELGKAGGKASAEARKIKPIPPKKAADESDKADEKAASKDAGEADSGAEAGASPADDGVADGEETPEQKRYREEGERRKRDARARVEEATRQAAEAKRERDALKAELEALKTASKPKEEAKSEEAAPSEDAKPKLADYDDLEKYWDDRDQWSKRQFINELRQQQEQHEAVSAQDRALANAQQKYSEHVRDFVMENRERISDDVLGLQTEFQLAKGQKPDASNWIANELFFSPENAPSLMLHFSEHPDEFQRIAALPNPRAVSREMAKLEARLELASSGNGSSDHSEPERVSKSKAPPPIKPVTGTPYVADGDPGPKPGESFDAWFKRSGHKGVRIPGR